MDYATASVTKYTNLPSDWEAEQIEEYLYKTLKLRNGDIYYMVGDSIPVKEEKYHAEKKRADKVLTEWKRLKKQHPDAVLLFRCGDFYETYREDAVEVSRTLGITLTERSNGTSKGSEMAGFPHYALDTYLPKLIRTGHRVAICDLPK